VHVRCSCGMFCMRVFCVGKEYVVRKLVYRTLCVRAFYVYAVCVVRKLCFLNVGYVYVPYLLCKVRCVYVAWCSVCCACTVCMSCVCVV